MAFDDLVRKSGKGLDVSKELVIALEINLGGTLGTQYFADKNVNIEGTYYDGRIISTSNVNRRIFPDIGSFEISNLGIEMANQDQLFYNPKWLRWSHGSPTELRIAFHGTRDLQQTDFNTRYKGYIEELNYDFNSDIFDLRIEDRTQNALKTFIPNNLIEDGDFPGMDTDLLELGRPVPYIYGNFSSTNPYVSEYSQSAPGILIGTYTEGTSKLLFADHACALVGGSPKVWQNGNEIAGTWIFYESGTISTYGTTTVAYMDLNHDVGTNAISTQIGHKTIEVASRVIRDMLEISGLIYPDDFGTLSFDKIYVKETGLNLYKGNRGYLTNQKTVKEHVDEICATYNFNLYVAADGKVNIKFTKFYHAGGAPYFSDGDEELGTRELNEDNFLSFYAYKDATHVTNSIQRLYNYSPIQGLFRYLGETNHETSQTRLGYTRSKRQESYWLCGTRGHFIPDNYFLGRFRYPIYKAKFTLPISELPLELTDYVQLTHSKTPNEYGTQGWKQKQMQIVGIEEDYNNMNVECECWEWGLPIPPWRLLAWYSFGEGDGTKISMEFQDNIWSSNNQDLYAPSNFEDELWANKINNDYVSTLDGTNQFLSNLDAGWQPNVTTGNVLGAFVKPDITPSGERMCILSNCKIGTSGWEFGIGTNNALYFSFMRKRAPLVWTEKFSQANAINPGTWQGVHVGINKVDIIDDQDMAVFFYLNGTQLGTTLYVVGTGLIQEAYQYNGIGASNVGTWGTKLEGTLTVWDGTVSGVRYFDGQIGDGVYYGGGTRTAADMTKLFDGLRGRYGL